MIIKESRAGIAYGSRENNINLLRFIAASMVIYSHMFDLLGIEDPNVMGMSFGAIAVNVFFLLSGYLIASSWTHSSSFPSYLIRRAARIFPALIVVVVASVLVIGPIFTSLSLNEYFCSFGTWKYLSRICFSSADTLPGVFESLPYPASVNASLWTIRYEFAMYLLVPIAYFLLGRFSEKTRKLLVAGALLGLLSCYVMVSAQILVLPAVIAPCFRLATYFFIGSVVFEFKLSRYFDVQYSVLALLFLLVFHEEEGALCISPAVAATTIFVFGFAFAIPPKFGKCFSKNDFSYGVYIWAFPIQQMLVQIGGGSSQDSVLAYSLVAYAVTLVFAVASWFLIEKPCMAWGKRFSKRF